MNPAPRSDDCPGAYDDERVDARFHADLGAGINMGFRIDAVRQRFGAAMQMTHDGHKRDERIGNLDNRQTVALPRLGNDCGGGGTGVQLRRVLDMLRKCNAALSCFAQRLGCCYFQIRIADNAAVNQFRQLPNGGTHARTPFLP